jgi:hypothetical protein
MMRGGLFFVGIMTALFACVLLARAGVGVATAYAAVDEGDAGRLEPEEPDAGH